MSLTRTATRSKPSPTKSTRVLFDASRRASVPNFGAGLLPPTRWSGQYDAMPFDDDDNAWLVALASRSIEEVEAEEDRYNEMLEARYLESAMIDRLCRGPIF